MSLSATATWSSAAAKNSGNTVSNRCELESVAVMMMRSGLESSSRKGWLEFEVFTNTTWPGTFVGRGPAVAGVQVGTARVELGRGTSKVPWRNQHDEQQIFGSEAVRDRRHRAPHVLARRAMGVQSCLVQHDDPVERETEPSVSAFTTVVRHRSKFSMYWDRRCPGDDDGEPVASVGW